MRPLDGYPSSFGNQRASIAGVVGPTSYANIPDTGLPVTTGGQVIEAVGFGLKFFDFVVAGESDSGIFFVEAIPITPTVGAPQNSAGMTYRLRWVSRVTAAVGGQSQVAFTEAVNGTNLSGEVIRIFALGPK